LDTRADEKGKRKKQFSVICLQFGLSVDRFIDAETAQTELHAETYQQKCKITPNLASGNAPSKGRGVGTRFFRAACLVLHPASVSTYFPPRGHNRRPCKEGEKEL
jgi:hypothetical protein